VPGTAMEPEVLFAALTPIALLQGYRLAMPPTKLVAPQSIGPPKSEGPPIIRPS
jgi:hypothetical protein